MTVQVSSSQAKVLDAIKVLSKVRGYPPTYAELANSLGLHPNAIVESVKILKRKGLVTAEEGKTRTLRVLEETP